MIDDAHLKPIRPSGVASTATATHVMSGLPIPKEARVQLLSPEDWEQFVQEWATSLKHDYPKIRRFGGSGDMGIDVACFFSNQGFSGGWDNYQCKRYDHPIRPGDVWVEIGKIIFYSFSGEYTVPRNHYFCAPRGIGTTLEKLFNDTTKLKQKCREEWAEKCETKITSSQTVPLLGTFLVYFDAFDFSIFSSKSVLDLVQGHSKTPYHAIRFGGGLPPRPSPETPPEQLQTHESRYIRQLLDAYADHTGSDFTDIDSLATNPNMTTNFRRQRERFYHAEALRNFARDTVPEGTFAQLQEEIYHGVADVCESSYPSGFDRMSATVSHAASIGSTANPLSPATNIQDRQGICHQLANNDRLQWVVKNG